jgi:hypothetical protein
MAEAFGLMSGPGSIHGASSPAARRSAVYCSRAALTVVVCTLIVAPPRAPAYCSSRRVSSSGWLSIG